MAQLQNVTVNSKPATQYMSSQKSREIQKFLAEEMRTFGRMNRNHTASHTTKSNKYNSNTRLLRALDHVVGEV